MGNGRFILYASGLAIVVTAVVQTAYTGATGVAMSTTLTGLAISCFLFIFVFLISYTVMARKNGMSVDRMISLYNDGCDPQAFVDISRSYAESVRPPFDASVSWFLSYYAQALLDLGRASDAQRIEQDFYLSIREQNNPVEQAKIVSNLIPLAKKLLGIEEVVPIIQKGIELLADAPATNDVVNFRAYLDNQMALAQAAVHGDTAKLAEAYSLMRRNPSLPLRARVEEAWEEAKLHFAQGDESLEVECLEFVVAHGNKLALVKPAHERLEAISRS